MPPGAWRTPTGHRTLIEDFLEIQLKYSWVSLRYGCVRKSRGGDRAGCPARRGWKQLGPGRPGTDSAFARQPDRIVTRWRCRKEQPAEGTPLLARSCAPPLHSAS